jgi:hypothetical protein
MPQKSVYFAGPEVFLANAREILDIKIALTRAAGLIPVSATSRFQTASRREWNGINSVWALMATNPAC